MMLQEFETTEDVRPPVDYSTVRNINRGRNFIRYKVIRGWNVDLNHPLLTPEERELVEQMNEHLERLRMVKEALKGLKIKFYTQFYNNCPKVGSTLKKVIKNRLIKLPFRQ